MARAVLLVCLLVALAASGARGQGTKAYGVSFNPFDDTAWPQDEMPTPTRPASDPPLVVLTLKGGLKVVRIVLTIEADGGAWLTEEGLNAGPRDVRWNVPPAMMAQLKQLLASEAFTALDERHGFDNACCDRIEYKLTAWSGRGGRTIEFVDGVSIPSALEELVDLLTQIKRDAPAG